MFKKQEKIPEEKLILLAKKDRKNFKLLYTKYFEKIYLFLLRRAENEDLAQDLTQQTFVKAMLNIEKFEFKGSVIFITNLKFDNVRGKIKDHLDAIMSRCHYLDLTLDTAREKLLRVKQIVKDGMLNSYKFSKDEEQEIVDFMLDNQDKLREISLRMCTKIADLRKSQSDRWKTMAEVTCMRRA